MYLLHNKFHYSLLLVCFELKRLSGFLLCGVLYVPALSRRSRTGLCLTPAPDPTTRAALDYVPSPYVRELLDFFIVFPGKVKLR